MRRCPTNAPNAATWNAIAKSHIAGSIWADCGAMNVSFSILPKRPALLAGFGNMPRRIGERGTVAHCQMRQAIPTDEDRESEVDAPHGGDPQEEVHVSLVPVYLTRLTRKTNSPPTFSADMTSLPVDFAHAGMSAMEPGSVATARMTPPTGDVLDVLRDLDHGKRAEQSLEIEFQVGLDVVGHWRSLLLVAMRRGVPGHARVSADARPRQAPSSGGGDPAVTT